MRFFIGVSTFGRIEYIKKLIDSIEETVEPMHHYTVFINDDGSKDGTREYLKNLVSKPNLDYVLAFSDNCGSHFANNSILTHALSFDFDLGFCVDDDSYFKKSGWELLYYRAFRESGYAHLSHFSTDWNLPPSNKLTRGRLMSVTNVADSQGAFFTFTKRMLADIGFFDAPNFGRRGEGHRDFSKRACRAGYNEASRFWDARFSDDYIALHPKQNYLLTPNYSDELRRESKRTDEKIKIARNPKRVRVENPKSFLNYFFDHIYVINLKRRPDRLERISTKLNQLKVDFEVFEAVDGFADKGISKMLKERNLTRLNPGIVGCHLSHLAVLKDAFQRGFEKPLILEDDLLFHIDFDEIIKRLPVVPNDWKLLYLGATDRNFTEPKRFFYRPKEADGTFAYSAKREALPQIISILDKPISIPCDTSLHAIQDEHKCYVLYPGAAIADVSDSDLREPRNVQKIALKVKWDVKKYY